MRKKNYGITFVFLNMQISLQVIMLTVVLRQDRRKKFKTKSQKQKSVFVSEL